MDVSHCITSCDNAVSTDQSNEIPAYPEYVIDEEPSKQDTASTDSVQLQKLNAVQCKSESEQIVGNPVL